MSSNTKIISLKAENFKRLSAVEISPDGSIVEISGRNGAGKSSVLDAIQAALCGADSICEEPIRQGESKARITCKLNGLTVTRTFTKAGGGTLTVESGDGARYPSPQAMLDKIVGKLVDPFEFVRIKPAAQLELLKNLVGLDFSALDNDRRKLYDERTQINRHAAQLKATVDGLPVHAAAPASEVSIQALMDEQAAANKQLDENKTKRNAITQLQTDRVLLKNRIDRELDKRMNELSVAQRTVADLQHQLSEALLALNAAEKTLTDKQDAAVKVVAELDAKISAAASAAADLVDPDINAISERIRSADSINRQVRENAQRAAAAQKLEAVHAEAGSLTARMEELDEQKAQALSATTFPVVGLSFGEAGITFNGVPFSQASSAEQLRVSVAIGLAMNPTLRVLLIRDGSLLDTAGMKLVADMAAERDAQIWIERVSDGKGMGMGIVIEDGHLAGVEVLETAAV